MLVDASIPPIKQSNGSLEAHCSTTVERGKAVAKAMS